MFYGTPSLRQAAACSAYCVCVCVCLCVDVCVRERDCVCVCVCGHARVVCVCVCVLMCERETTQTKCSGWQRSLMLTDPGSLCRWMVIHRGTSLTRNSPLLWDHHMTLGIVERVQAFQAARSGMSSNLIPHPQPSTLKPLT